MLVELQACYCFTFWIVTLHMIETLNAILTANSVEKAVQYSNTN